MKKYILLILINIPLILSAQGRITNENFIGSWKMIGFNEYGEEKLTGIKWTFNSTSIDVHFETEKIASFNYIISQYTCDDSQYDDTDYHLKLTDLNDGYIECYVVLGFNSIEDELSLSLQSYDNPNPTLFKKDCTLDSDNDGYNDCEDRNNAVNNTTITSNFTEDKGGWRNNGSVATTLEEGRLKVSNVDSSWEGIQRPLDELRIAPGQQLNISLDFDQGDTSANVRLYVQEQDAEGNHLSWNVINGKLQTRTYNYTYTIKTGHKAILRIDKSNTHLEETTHFYVDTIEVKLLDCTLDSDGDGTNDCEDRCPSIVGPSLGGVGFNNGCPFEVEHARDPLLPRN
jgi:hypothetical protein